jgi:hypothetical protein
MFGIVSSCYIKKYHFHQFEAFENVVVDLMCIDISM